MARPVKLYQVDLSEVSDEPTWYTALVNYKCEKKVYDAIVRFNDNTGRHYIDAVYVPFNFKKSIKQDKHGVNISVFTPVAREYSGYVFFKAKLNEYIWNSLRLIPGITMIILSGNTPAVVPGKKIKQIRKACIEEYSLKDQRKIMEKYEYYRSFEEDNSSGEFFSE